MDSGQLLGKAEEMLVGNLAIDWQVGVVIVLVISFLETEISSSWMGHLANRLYLPK